MGLLKTAIIIAVLSYTIYLVVNLWISLKIFNETYNHSNGDCKTVDGIEFGSEDIKVLPDGRSFISSGLKLSNEGRKNSVGGIYMFDFNKPQDRAQHIEVVDENGQPLPLVPHGLGLWIDDKQGVIYLYVVNHYGGNESVEKLKFCPKEMKLSRATKIMDEKTFYALNGIHLIGEDQFYFTNFFYFNHLIELVLGLHWGNVGFFNGKEGNIVLKGLNAPNGIIKWKNFILVGLTFAGKLNVYTEESNHILKLKQTIKINSMVDNIKLDRQSDDLILGCHASLFKIIRHSFDPDANKSPSQILRLKLHDNGDSEIMEIYSNDGSEVSGSSVGVLYEDAMLIGTIYTDLLYCKFDHKRNSF